MILLRVMVTLFLFPCGVLGVDFYALLKDMKSEIGHFKHTLKQVQESNDALHRELEAVHLQLAAMKGSQAFKGETCKTHIEGDNFYFTGCNVHVLNGEGATNTTNGVGNIIVGYNEFTSYYGRLRTGSHVIVVGSDHEYTSYGGIVVGKENTIAGPYASVSGGYKNTAGEGFSDNLGEKYASVSGGCRNSADAQCSSVSGGYGNMISREATAASVSGGSLHEVEGERASISGGYRNFAYGYGSSILGGDNNQIGGVSDENVLYATISGGHNNEAQGNYVSITGGRDNTVAEDYSSVLGRQTSEFLIASKTTTRCDEAVTEDECLSAASEVAMHMNLQNKLEDRSISMAPCGCLILDQKTIFYKDPGSSSKCGLNKKVDLICRKHPKRSVRTSSFITSS